MVWTAKLRTGLREDQLEDDAVFDDINGVGRVDDWLCIGAGYLPNYIDEQNPHLTFAMMNSGVNLRTGEMIIGGVQPERPATAILGGCWKNGSPISKVEVSSKAGYIGYRPILFHIERMFSRPATDFSLGDMLSDGVSEREGPSFEYDASEVAAFRSDYGRAVSESLCGKPIIEADFRAKFRLNQLMQKKIGKDSCSPDDFRFLYGERIYEELKSKITQ